MGDGTFYDPLSGMDMGGSNLGPLDSDVAPAGAGGDPYGTGDPYAPADLEAGSTGRLPGGQDAQLGPWSPDQGFDFSNLFKPAAWVGAGRGSGSGFIGAGTGGFPLLPPGGGGAASDGLDFLPMRRARASRCPVGALDASSSTGEIVRWVRENTGLRVTAASIVGLIVRYGFRAAAALTQLDLRSLLALFMQKKGVRHHHRGPGLYTVARKLRSADRLRATAARILGRGYAYHRHARHRAPYHTFHRRRRRKR